MSAALRATIAALQHIGETFDDHWNRHPRKVVAFFLFILFIGIGISWRSSERVDGPETRAVCRELSRKYGERLSDCVEMMKRLRLE
jgi:hypothetical protein